MATTEEPKVWLLEWVRHPAGGKRLEPIECARRAVELAADKQATDVLLLDVRALVNFADYMVLMSAESARQVDALAQGLRRGLREEGVPLHHQEGTPASGWMLLDFADVIVHVFALEQREYYRLEELWSAGRPLVRIQ